MSDDVVTTPFGKFLITEGDIIGETLRAGTLWDGPGFLQPIAIEYGRLGEKSVTILDVGANLGSFSVWLARHGAWRVLAFEPVPPTMQMLKANLDLNKDVTSSRVIPIEVAAYAFPCRMTLARPLDPGNLGGIDLIPDPAGAIQAARLDDYRFLCGHVVSLVKIDAQGCDGAALLGMSTLLQQDRPVVVFEWEADLAEPHGQTLEATIAYLTALRYDVHLWPSYANNYLAVPQ